MPSARSFRPNLQRVQPVASRWRCVPPAAGLRLASDSGDAPGTQPARARAPPPDPRRPRLPSIRPRPHRITAQGDPDRLLGWSSICPLAIATQTPSPARSEAHPPEASRLSILALVWQTRGGCRGSARHRLSGAGDFPLLQFSLASLVDPPERSPSCAVDGVTQVDGPGTDHLGPYL